MARQNDQVFQLSLTEIAFMIAFLLMLLLGYLVYKEQIDRLAAEAELSKIQTAEHATFALQEATSKLSSTLQNSGVKNPNDIINDLIATKELRIERDHLKKQIEDLDAKLTTLIEIKKQLEQTPPANRSEVMQKTIASALAFQNQVRTALEKNTPDLSSAASSPQPTVNTNNLAGQAVNNEQALKVIRQALTTTDELRRQIKEKLNRELPVGQEIQTVQEIVSLAKSFNDLDKGTQSPEGIKKENSDLRGQVAFLRHRLDARGGRDYPPCWADETGKVEFLFSIEVRSDSVIVAPAWPPRRETVARALPGIEGVLSESHSNQAFATRIQGIFNWSKSQDPECRHYVQFKSSIPDAVQSDRARLMVESYFYKVEARR